LDEAKLHLGVVGLVSETLCTHNQKTQPWEGHLDVHSALGSRQTIHT
jgi:hypothetical protein